MNFIGNDITAFTEINYKTFSRKGAKEKILAPTEELFLFPEQELKEIMWLWSCKEAAYKLSVKLGLRTAFSPRMFSIVRTSIKISQVNKKVVVSGKVAYKDFCYKFKSEIDRDYVYTICTEQSHNKKAVNKILAENLLPYNFLKTHTRFDFPIIEKTEWGAPYIRNKFDNKIADISISHDNNLTAYAILR